MCRRDTNDVLVRRFLDRYQVNLLSMPSRRVRCGSVYISEGGRLTAPGSLNDIIEPPVVLGDPFREDDLPDLSGTWSDSVSVNVSIGLLQNFLAALGAVGLIDKLEASVRQANARSIAFRLGQVSRESLSPMAIGAALVGHRFGSNSWVRAGNQYYAVAAVLRSGSISVQGRDKQGSIVDVGVGVATFVDAKAGVEVKRERENEVAYSGREPLVFGVELYELRWDEDEQELAFHTPKGPVPVRGAKPEEPPAATFVGGGESAFIDAEEPGSS